MARKTLLTESELRSFMKLAELRPLGDEKIAEMYGTYEAEAVEEEIDMEMDAEEEPMGDEDADMDMEVDMEMPMDDTEDAGAQMVSVDDFMGALERALEDVLGDEVEVEMDDEEEMDDEADIDMEMGADKEPMMEEEHEEDDRVKEEELVNEVARRVAARLQQESDKVEVVDKLAERILNRLTSK